MLRTKNAPACIIAALMTMSPAVAAEFDWKFAHVVSPSTPSGKAADRFAELVNKRSGGRISVKVFPSAQLGSDTQIVEQIQFNSVQVGIPPTAKLGNFDQRMQVIDLPFIFPTREAVYKVLDGPIGQKLLAGLESKALMGLAIWESGFKHLTSNRPISDVSDLKGIKVRTMDSPLIIEQYRSWGANPIPVAFAEVYNALQSGVAEAQENSLSNIDTMKFFEVQTHLTLSGHAYLAYAFVVSKQAWDALPKDLQMVVQKAAIEARDYGRDLTIKLDEALAKRFKADGMNVSTLTEKARDGFISASREVHDSFAPVVSRELLDQIYEVSQ